MNYNIKNDVIYSLNKKIVPLIPISPSTIYSVAEGILINGATLNDTGTMVKNLGGKNNGAAFVGTNIGEGGKYNIFINFSGEEIPFKIDINGYDDGKVYITPSLSDGTFHTVIELNTGGNILSFYGNANEEGPQLGEFTLVKIPLNQTELLPKGTYDLSRGIFSNGATLDTLTNFVTNLGGIYDGGVSFNFFVEKENFYITEIQYLSYYESTSFKAKVNEIDVGYFTVPTTEGWDIDSAKKFSFIVKLKAGDNEIKFHGDGLNDAPLLGLFSIGSIAPYIKTNIAFDYKSLNLLTFEDLSSLLKEINYKNILALYELSPDCIEFFSDENRLNTIINTLIQSGNTFTINDDKGIETLAEVLRAGYYLANKHDELSALKNVIVKNKCLGAIKAVQINSNFNLSTPKQITIVKSIARLIECTNIDIDILNSFIPILKQFKSRIKIDSKEFKKRDTIYFIIKNIEVVLNNRVDENNKKFKNTIFYGNIDNFISALEELVQIKIDYPNYATNFITNLIFYIGKFSRFRVNKSISQMVLTNCTNIYDYLSKPYIEAINALNRYFKDKFSNGLNVEYEKKIEEAKNKYLPNTYKFYNESIIIRAGNKVNKEQVKKLYWATHEIKSQFFRTIGSNFPADFTDSNKPLNIIIYNSYEDFSLNFRLFKYYAKGILGLYIELINTIFTFNLSTNKALYNLEYLFRHEYTHYLQEKYTIAGVSGASSFIQVNTDKLLWFQEGTAQFFAGATRKDGIKASKALVKKLTNSSLKPIDKIVRASFGTFDFYKDAFALVYYLYNNRRGILNNLNSLTKFGSSNGYNRSIENLANSKMINDDFKRVIDDLSENLENLTLPYTSDDYLINHPNKDITEIETDILSLINLDEPMVEYHKSDFFNTFSLIGTYYSSTNMDYIDEWNNMNKLLDKILTNLEAKPWSGYKTVTAYFTDYFVTDEDEVVFNVVFQGFLSS